MQLNPVELLHFRVEDDGYSVYNPALVEIDGVLHMWGRTEKEGVSERGGSVRLYKENLEDGIWDQVEGAPIFPGMQDPFYCGVIEGYHVMGGVELYDIPGSPNPGYRTVFYRYQNSPAELMDDGVLVKPFAKGPNQMKGIRILPLPNGKLGVFTRPQGRGFGGRGQIGYLETNSLDTLETDLIAYDKLRDPSTLLWGLFAGERKGEGEWGGVNMAYALPDDTIFVIGHIARFHGVPPLKYYYPMSFVFDPSTHTTSDFKLLATDKEYPDGLISKNDQLGKIYYPAGLGFIHHKTKSVYDLADRRVGIQDI